MVEYGGEGRTAGVQVDMEGSVTSTREGERNDGDSDDEKAWCTRWCVRSSAMVVVVEGDTRARNTFEMLRDAGVVVLYVMWSTWEMGAVKEGAVKVGWMWSGPRGIKYVLKKDCDRACDFANVDWRD